MDEDVSILVETETSLHQLMVQLHQALDELGFGCSTKGEILADLNDGVRLAPFVNADHDVAPLAEAKPE